MFINKFDLQKRVLGIFDTLGCLMAVDADGRCAGLGTVTLVHSGTEKLLLTADHVVSGLEAGAFALKLLVNRGPASDQVHEFDYSLSVRWRSKQLDVAALAPPTGLVDDPYARWFDLRVQRTMLTKLRSIRDKYDNEDESLPYYIVGIPNFGRAKFEEARIEIMGLIPLPVYISQLERKPWSGNPSVVPQMHLEVDAERLDPDFKPADLARAVLHERLSNNPPKDSQALGGLSGGPVVLLAGDGDFLLGIVKEGSIIFDQKRAVATPIDDLGSAPGFPLSK
jgi:hypothetical protein